MPQPEQVGTLLRELVTRQVGAESAGSILVATEGINGMLAGSPAAVDGFEHALQHEPAFAAAFTGMAFKRSTCITRPLGKMKVHVKKELVPATRGCGSR